MNAHSPVIYMEGVERAFGGKAVLRGISGKIEAGRVVGILGRNGEGKTTLFRILLDLLAADAGRVSVLGSAPDGTGSLRARVGYVPERPAFHGFMSAGEVLEWRARYFPNWSRERALAVSRRLELDLSERVGAASKGTLGKLAWACASAHDPELYLLDEPTSGLDALVRHDVLEALIGELADAGRTVLVANHHMEEMAGLLDEVWVLKEGRVAAVYDTERLRSEARRITGRLKGAKPELAGLVELGAEGPLVSWAAFDRAAEERIAGQGALESMESAPLPLEDALRLLLKR